MDWKAALPKGAAEGGHSFESGEPPRTRVPFFCLAKRKEPKKRPPGERPNPARLVRHRGRPKAPPCASVAARLLGDAILHRQEGRGSPSVANPLGGTRVHRHASYPPRPAAPRWAIPVPGSDARGVRTGTKTCNARNSGRYTRPENALTILFRRPRDNPEGRTAAAFDLHRQGHHHGARRRQFAEPGDVFEDRNAFLREDPMGFEMG